MDKKKVIYIGILFIVTVIVSITYFSYAYLTRIDEQKGKINVVVGTLDYKLISTDLIDNSIVIEANTKKTIEIEIKSLNEIDSKYELYYLVNSEDVEIGYSPSTVDLPIGNIEALASKNITIIIDNTSSSNQIVTFGIDGGLTGNELVLSEGNEIDIANVCAYQLGATWTYDYKGSPDTFTTPCEGIYKVELWGAQGGYSYNSTDSIYAGGKGAYTSGELELNKNEVLSVTVGGMGNHCHCNSSIDCCGNNGGYNGGGKTLQYTGGTTYYGSGGGATDIRYGGTTLNDRIMVAAGGGGASNWTGYNYIGGAGGSITGLAGTYTKSDRDLYCTGGSQTAAGTGTYNSGSAFGQGGISSGYIGPGGGGGYYGGGTSETYSCGGSSYISGMVGFLAVTSQSSLTPKTGCSTGLMSIPCSYHYSNKVFTNTDASSGENTMPTHSGTGTMVGNTGNGYAKITLVAFTKEEVEANRTWDFDYKGIAQSFTAPVTGKYKIELWGAQGGYSQSNSTNYLGGAGGYTSGEIDLTKDTTLNIIVGGSGKPCACHDTKTCCGNNGGYNGGGNSLQYTGTSTYYGSGGGATDVRLNASLNSRIMVAAGGGGASNYTAYNFIGGSAGGITGNIGTYTKTDRYNTCTGGSQTAGGTGTYSAGSGFGQGAYAGNIYGPGGGAGYYGGGTSETYSCGGSSYISGHQGSIAIASASSTGIKSGCTAASTTLECSKHYSGLYFTNTEVIDGSGYNWNTTKDVYVGQPQPNGTSSQGHSGNGYARITYLGN